LPGRERDVRQALRRHLSRAGNGAGRCASARRAGRDRRDRGQAVTEFVDLETAKAARGMRLVVVGSVPSPWSESAKAIFRIKKIPFVAVRLVGKDDALRAWTGVSNAPAAMHDDEPPRTGWAEILALAERVAPEPALVPEAADDRATMFGWAHEILGEN